MIIRRFDTSKVNNDDPTWRAVDRGAFKLTAHRLVMDDTDAVKFKLIHGSHD
jgi:hypothetical protein